MITRSWLTAMALVAPILGGCAGRSNQDAKDSWAESESVVRGSVAYRERMALPEDAEIEVWITDISPVVQAVPIVAQTTVRADGRQVPIAFELPYERERIDSEHTYAVKAVIRSGGQVMFETTDGQPVITQGNPKQVNLMLATAAAPAPSSTPSAGILDKTGWRLMEVDGTPAIERAEATLEFMEGGKMSGKGACNRFFGTVSVKGDSIQFSKLGATLMACIDEVGAQEKKYFQALETAERFALDGENLVIYSKGSDKPLRFARKGD
jgi:putative lipoprotein